MAIQEEMTRPWGWPPPPMMHFFKPCFFFANLYNSKKNIKVSRNCLERAVQGNFRTVEHSMRAVVSQRVPKISTEYPFVWNQLSYSESEFQLEFSPVREIEIESVLIKSLLLFLSSILPLQILSNSWKYWIDAKCISRFEAVWTI